MRPSQPLPFRINQETNSTGNTNLAIPYSVEERIASLAERLRDRGVTEDLTEEQ
jgi:hypothetical protein